MTLALCSPKDQLLTQLSEAVSYCSLCNRMSERRKVLSERNGNVHSRVMFVAEAPGRLGADKTGIPLYGDRSGENFGLLLDNVGWNRDQVFVTNAVLCNPQDDSGNNGKPTSQELSNCSTYLRMVINLVDPEVVVSLGQVALDALGRIEPHSLTLKQSVGERIRWHDRHLVPLYHPGPRALLHRSMLKQRADFIKLAGFVDPKAGIRERPVVRKPELAPNEPVGSRIQQVISIILGRLGQVSLFRMCKLLFLVDLASFRFSGKTLTEAVYLRQADGPWFPALYRALTLLDHHELNLCSIGKRVIANPGYHQRYAITLRADEVELILDVLEQYGDLNESKLKTAVYLTAPMRHVLREEKRGTNMRNCVVLYKDRSIDQVQSLEEGTHQ